MIKIKLSRHNSVLNEIEETTLHILEKELENYNNSIDTYLEWQGYYKNGWTKKKTLHVVKGQ